MTLSKIRVRDRHSRSGSAGLFGTWAAAVRHATGRLQVQPIFISVEIFFSGLEHQIVPDSALPAIIFVLLPTNSGLWPYPWICNSRHMAHNYPFRECVKCLIGAHVCRDEDGKQNATLPLIAPS